MTHLLFLFLFSFRIDVSLNAEASAVQQTSEIRRLPAAEKSHGPSCSGVASCSCHPSGDGTFTINCTKAGLEKVPVFIGEDSSADVLFLPSNKISHLDLEFLLHYPVLKSLSLRDNSLRSLSKSTNDYQPFFR